jgi:putative ABC transport system permease protein
MLDILRQDLRYALRSLGGRRVLVAVTVLTLSLGIGVVTALFAVVDAAVLRPFANDQDRLVRVWMKDSARGLARHPIGYPEFLRWRDETRAFDALAAIDYNDAYAIALDGEGQSPGLTVAPVSASFFETVARGGAPLYGRWLRPDDERSTSDLVAVVSARFWRRQAASDPSLVGRRLPWGAGRTLHVVGIAPAHLEVPLGTDAWVPVAPLFKALAHPVNIETDQTPQFELIGHLAPGRSREEARAELDVLHARMIAERPGDHWAQAMPVEVEPLTDVVLGDTRRILLFLFGAAGLVFAIGGVNVAALLLMRASDRSKELAVRVALGATRARLVRQTLTESLLLAAMGTAGGLAMAAGFLHIARGLSPTDVPRIAEAALDLRVLAFCMVAALAWVLAFGTAPVWSRRRMEMPALGSSALSTRGERGTRALRVFTIAEIAAALVVAVGAGLLLRSFVRLSGINRGIASAQLELVRISLPKLRYPDAASRLAFFEQLLPRVTAIPGVVAATTDHVGPGTGSTGLSAGMIFEGQTAEEAKRNPWAGWEPITPSYFQTLGIPIVRGRGFTSADRSDGAGVVVVSESVARRYWPGQDPIGKRLRLGAEFPWVTVVGVVADTRYRELRRDWLTVYFPAAKFFFFDPGCLVVRAEVAPAALVPALRATIRAQDREAAVISASTMDAELARELARPRTAVTVTGVFALMAVGLAWLGVYGVISYEVVQRRRELAVRSALGASPSRIYRSVVGRSLALGLGGIALGCLAAAVLTRSLQSLLFEVGPGDPVSFVAGGGLLLSAVLLAALAPARRAAAADPVTALRIE